MRIQPARDAIVFEVFGVPTAKGRPRRSKNGGVFTPDKTRRAEESFINKAVRYRPEVPLSGPIFLWVVFRMPIPKAKMKKWRENIPIFPTGRPDLDNLIKLVKDALNGVFWLDDKQVVELRARKEYAEIPSTKVQLMEVAEC